MPVGPRTIRCTLLMTWSEGAYNDALADNLSLSLVYAAPVLNIACSADSAVISWAWQTDDWILQTTTNLAKSDSWQTVAQPYSSNAGFVTKEISGLAASPTRFYRLRK